MPGMSREMTPPTRERWREVLVHHRAGLNALTRVGNALRPMAAPAGPKARAVDLHCRAYDEFADLGFDLAAGLVPEGVAIGDDAGLERREPGYHTDRRLVMTRHRWVELGDEMLSALAHAGAITRLATSSPAPFRGERYARRVRWVEKLRSALDDLVVAMEPDWNRAEAVFYRAPGGRSPAEGLGPADPAGTIASFFETPRRK